MCFQTSTERSDFLRRIQQLIMKLATYAPIDGAADQVILIAYSWAPSLHVRY